MKQKTLSSLIGGKTVLVTGGTGSIGSEIVRQVLQARPKQLRVFSRDEYKQYRLAQSLGRKENVRFLIGDVRDRDRVQKAMENVDAVFHAAALKHVPACEYNPFEAVQTNVVGTQNVVEKALYAGVERLLCISTDKAAAPLSVMGATKLLSEKVATSAIYHQGKRSSICSAVRFGNVLGSRGSVLETFREQLLRGGPITVTHPRMTRFIMTIADAVTLVLEAFTKMQGSEVFILKMPVVRIADLAKVYVEEEAPLLGLNPKQIRTTLVGARPGEKQDELLMTREESRLALELSNMFVIRPFLQFEDLGKISPHTYAGARKAKVADYSSGDRKTMSQKDVRAMLSRVRTSARCE